MRARTVSVGLASLATIVLLSAASTRPAVADTTVTVSVEAIPTPADPMPAVADKPPFEGKRPAVDVALLLDTSNSMDGLISQAKAQLWKIVNRFADAKRDGKTPVLRVALFEYGNTRLPASEGYIRQVVPLTDDLDDLSAALFALKTSGGDEYCGQVISEAVKRLDWSEEPGGYKAVFVAGNEPFTQGPVDYRKACKQAIENGIVVNTIHCGAYSSGVSGQWAHGAQLAEGCYLNIDQDQAVARIPAPQDKVIIELSDRLNDTYLWYGKGAHRYRANQQEQDSNASKLSFSIAADRAQTKASSNYSNRGRDLVDTFNADNDALDTIEAEELPEPLRKMTADERVARIKELSAERVALQKQIQELSQERDKFLAEARKKQAGEKGEATLGEAVTKAIDEQLVAAGFAVE